MKNGRSTNNQQNSNKVNNQLPINGKHSPNVNDQPNKKRTQGNSKENTNNNNNKKPQIHQIINLDQYQSPKVDQLIQPKGQQQFISEVAKKCGAFFNWINQVDDKLLGEQLWKNKMLKVSGERFPELTPDQAQRLIDRDWRIMNAERRQQILRQMRLHISYQSLQQMVNQDYEQEKQEILNPSRDDRQSRMVDYQDQSRRVDTVKEI